VADTDKNCKYDCNLVLWIITGRRRKRRFRIDSQVCCMGAHPLGGAMSRRGRSPIKLAYSPSRPDGRLKLTASAFNRLDQYTCSPGHMCYCCAELAVSSQAMGVITGSTHFTIPQRVEG